MLRGLGASEGWTDTFVSAAAHDDVGLTGPAVRVANPLDAEKPFLRRSLCPACSARWPTTPAGASPTSACSRSASCSRTPTRARPGSSSAAGAGGTETAELPGERELLSAVFAREDDDARDAVAAWHVLADALHLDGVRLVPPGDGMPPFPGLHPTRSAHLVARAGGGGTVTHRLRRRDRPRRGRAGSV